MTQAFLDAIKGGDAPKVREMLREDPSLANAHTSSGLHSAVLALYYGKKDIADAILAHKPTLDLHAAATVGDLARVRALVEKNSKSVHSYSADGFPPLGLAAYMGHKGIVEYLISKGADVHQTGQDESGRNALTGAVASGHVEVARILLEKDMDPNHRYEGGFTPVLEAAANGDVQMLTLLVEHGGDPNARGPKGETALSLARQRDHPDAVDFLRKHGARE